MANKYVLVPVANGTEELEAVTVIDTLRYDLFLRLQRNSFICFINNYKHIIYIYHNIYINRRAGAKVTVASVEPELVVKCSRGVTIQADELLRTCANSTYDLIVLPGKRIHYIYSYS